MHKFTLWRLSQGPSEMDVPDPDILGQVLVVSGGSGYNDLVGATPNAIYVLPGKFHVADH